MLEKILKMQGSTLLNAYEQREIKGGRVTAITSIDSEGGGFCSDACTSDSDCGYGQECFTGKCDGDDTKMCRVAR
ncbi:hypothetical protein [uncultured Tenacibaculum sp.]|uniref:hypothetical protein n=1 Tax=uncultured Tenacibaculum sp. TaxID=174713 RepID=UPI00261ECF64|nr:hypothetical protein [uncultured Tenacibaculum sp.]